MSQRSAIKILVCALALSLALPSLAAAQPNKHRLLLTNTAADNVVAYDRNTGAFLGEFIGAGAGLDSPDSMIIGPDGMLYISTGTTLANSAVLRFDPDTGALIDTFASGNGMFRPYGIGFGPDGLLYVASFLSDELLRFDGAGNFVDVFATGDGFPGGLNGPNGITFGPDGRLYITTQGSIAVNGVPTFPGLPSQVLSYDISNGTSEVFATPNPSPEGFGFVSLLGIEFTPNCKSNPQSSECDVFVSDFANDIRRYDVDGNLEAVYSTNYTGTLPSNNFVGSLSFGRGGNLYSTGFDLTDAATPGAILRYKWTENADFPADGNSGAIFVGPTNDLVRSIGILALPRP